jgi:hypothetical protein
MAAGDLAAGLALAQAAARGTAGYEQFSALALAGRLATWGGDADAAAEAMTALDAHAAWGRSATAARQTLRAGVEVLRSGSQGAGQAEGDWSAAMAAWRELDLPLRLGLCHLDRCFLLKDPADRAAAAEIFGRLGATAMVALAEAGVGSPR